MIRRPGCWHVGFRSAASAEEGRTAVESHRFGLPTRAPVVQCFQFFNTRAYEGRGWCCFETAVSTEFVERAAFYPRGFREGLSMSVCGRPKLIDIDSSPPHVADPDPRHGPTKFAQVQPSTDGTQ